MKKQEQIDEAVKLIEAFLKEYDEWRRMSGGISEIPLKLSARVGDMAAFAKWIKGEE